MKYCDNCKRCIESQAKFCPYCGRMLGNNDPNVGAPDPVPGVSYHAYSALVLGILSLACYCLGATIIAVPILAILGIVYASVSKPKGGRMSGMARAGQICSILSLVLFVLLMLIVLIVVAIILTSPSGPKKPPESSEPYVQWIVQKARFRF